MVTIHRDSVCFLALVLCAIISTSSSQNPALNNQNIAGYGGLNGLGQGLGNPMNGIDNLAQTLSNLGLLNAGQQTQQNLNNPGLGYGLGELASFRTRNSSDSVDANQAVSV
jgi:hydrogenase/urease accessory protein HupE